MITFPNFEKYDDKLFHCFTTREGGVSPSSFDSLNLSFRTGDACENVTANYGILARAAGLDTGSFTLSDQVHGVKLRHATGGDRGKGLTRESDIRETDGMYTDEPGITLVTLYADCVPVYIYSPDKNVIGLAHSGWKGTVGRISALMVAAMHERFSCDPAQMIATAGPAIGKCCYEVGGDLKDRFENEIPWSAGYFKREGGRYMLDLRGIIGEDLTRSGLKSGNIHISELCTCCRPDLFFSHRASGGRTGRMAAVMALR